MSNPQLSIEAEFKGGALNTGLDSLVKKEDQVDAGLKKITGEAKKADAELARFAKRTTEINATPVEKYSQHVAKLDAALAKGRITLETHTRAVGAANAKMLDLGTTAQKVAGPSALGMVKQYAGGFVSLGAAVGVVSSALADADQQAQRALSTMRSLTDLRIELNQVGGQKLEEDAEYASQRYGLNRKEAYSFYRDAQNLGIKQADADYVASRRWGVGDLTKVGEGIGIVPKLFGNKITPVEALNMMGSAAEASRLNPQKMTGVMSDFAGGAKELGTSPEQAIAFAALMSSKYGSESEAGTAAKEFQQAMAIRGQAGKGGTFETIKSLQGMDQAQRDEIFKEDKSIRLFYSRAQDVMGEVKPLEAKMAKERALTGTSGDWISRADAQNRRNPKIAADALLTGAQSAEELANENAGGVKRADAEAAANYVLAHSNQRGRNPIAYYSAAAYLRGAKAVGANAPTTAAAGLLGSATGQSIAPQIQNPVTGPLVLIGALLSSLRDVFGEQKAAATELKGAAESQRLVNDQLKSILTTGRGKAFGAAARQPVQ